MIDLPDFSKAFDYENAFYLSCETTRLSKVLSHYDLFRMAMGLSGEIVECGVFKGASLVRFAMMRELFGGAHSKRIVGFDIFGKFPDTEFADDVDFRQRFVDAAGDESIDIDQLRSVLNHKGVDRNIEFVAGDINETVPAYVATHPELRISLLNLDTDIYEPAVTVLEHLWPLVVPGGVLILDDYGTFPGETRAVDDYFADQDIRIQKLPYAMTPSFIVKGAGPGLPAPG